MGRRKIDLSTSGQGNIIDMKTGNPIEKPVLPVICERIKFYREQAGIEQKELAKRIGITANSISNWENGRSRPDINLLPAICRELEISFYELYDIPDPTIKFTVNQTMLVDRYSVLSKGHQHAVDHLSIAVYLSGRKEHPCHRRRTLIPALLTPILSTCHIMNPIHTSIPGCHSANVPPSLRPLPPCPVMTRW